MNLPNEPISSKNANRSANLGCLLLLLAFLIIASSFGFGALYEYRRIKSGAPVQPSPLTVPPVPQK